MRHPKTWCPSGAQIVSHRSWATESRLVASRYESRKTPRLLNLQNQCQQSVGLCSAVRYSQHLRILDLDSGQEGLPCSAADSHIAPAAAAAVAVVAVAVAAEDNPADRVAALAVAVVVVVVAAVAVARTFAAGAEAYDHKRRC